MSCFTGKTDMSLFIIHIKRTHVSSIFPGFTQILSENVRLVVYVYRFNIFLYWFFCVGISFNEVCFNATLLFKKRAQQEK